MSPWLGALRRRGAAARSQPAAAPMPKREPPAPAPPSLAVRVRTAVESMRPLSEAPKTAQEIAAGTAALRPEGAVPATALHRVLGGQDAAAQDLTAAQLTTLAEFYGLEPAYFLGSDAEVERIDAALEFMRELREPDAGTPFICGGLASLTPSGLRGYSALMRSTRALLAERDARAAAAGEPAPAQTPTQPTALPVVRPPAGRL